MSARKPILNPNASRQNLSPLAVSARGLEQAERPPAHFRGLSAYLVWLCFFVPGLYEVIHYILLLPLGVSFAGVLGGGE